MNNIFFLFSLLDSKAQLEGLWLGSDHSDVVLFHTNNPWKKVKHWKKNAFRRQIENPLKNSFIIYYLKNMCCL